MIGAERLTGSCCTWPSLGVVLGDGVHALLQGLLGQLLWQDQAHGRPDIMDRDGQAPALTPQAPRPRCARTCR